MFAGSRFERRALAASAVLAVSVAAAGATRGAQASIPGPALPSLQGFPSADWSIESAEINGLTRVRAAQALAAAPASPDTIRLLLSQTPARVSDALDVLDRVIASQPSRAADAFRAVTASSFEITRDSSRGFRDRLKAQVDAAPARLASLPREDAARLARALVDAAWIFNADRADRLARLQALSAAYPGTAAAADAELDLLNQSADSSTRAEAYGRFAKAHPGTEIGAHAQYLRVSALSQPPRSERAQADPTDRFLEWSAAIDELEHGGFPKCQWTEQAAQLATQFSTNRPSYTPEHLDAVIAIYLTRLSTNFVVSDRVPAGNGDGYALTGKLADLFAQKTDPGAFDQALDDLERRAANPQGIHFVRAMADVDGRRLPAAAPGRAAVVSRGMTTLRAIAAAQGPYAQRALAEVASRSFVSGDFSAAAAGYGAYVREYPASDWAWVAAIRLGQARSALGQWPEAQATFERAAATYRDLPLARVVAATLAGRAAETSGRIAPALQANQLALAAWDDRFVAINDERYEFGNNASGATGPAPFGSVAIDRRELEEHIAWLTRAQKDPAGPALARARGLLDQRRWHEARAAFASALATWPKSTLAADARIELGRAAIGEALAHADVAGPARSDAEALNALAAIAPDTGGFALMAADFVRAALQARSGAPAAGATLAPALDRWLRTQQLSPAPPGGTLEADVNAICAAVFRPTGGGVYSGRGANAFSWPGVTPPWMIVSRRVPVVLSDATIRWIDRARPIDGYDHVLFADREQLDTLAGVINSIAGDRTRMAMARTPAPMPANDPAAVPRLFNQFFPLTPGFAVGWRLETFPRIDQIVFHDAARTKATARVTVALAGGNVTLEKTEGIWRATGFTDLWVE